MSRDEDTFARLGDGLIRVRKADEESSRGEVKKDAREAWWLVRIFAPGVGGQGDAKYSELILKRPV